MGIKRERAPFVFTTQFKNVLDSKGSSGFKDFQDIFWKAYQILREHSDVLVTLLRILICTDIPELKESIESWSVPINFFIHYVANK